MQLQARLVHAEPGRRVVELSAHQDGLLLGSALGEGATAEEAEDRALARLQRRLGQPEPAQPQRLEAEQPQPERPSLPKAATPPSEAPAAPSQTIEEPAPDPEDWSSELTQIDLELRRLGWRREQETIYLERAFGHPSRSRLTTYGDLMAYLQALQGLEPGCDPASAAVPLRRSDLLLQCDMLLGQLHWDAAQGRQFLENHFQLSSRQQLSDAQLLQFNMLLESELIGA